MQKIKDFLQRGISPVWGIVIEIARSLWYNKDHEECKVRI